MLDELSDPMVLRVDVRCDALPHPYPSPGYTFPSEVMK